MSCGPSFSRWAAISLVSAAVLFLSLPSATEGVNILVIDGTPSPSHQLWMRVLNQALASHGYNVTVLSCKGQSDPRKNLTYLEMTEVFEFMATDFEFDFLDTPNMGALMKYLAFLPYYAPLDEVIMGSSGLKSLIDYPADFKFDLVIYDYLSPYVLLGLVHRFKHPPLVAVSPYPGIGMTNLITKGPDYFPLVPHMLKDDVEECFLDRLGNLLMHVLFHFTEQWYILPGASSAARMLIPGLGSVQDILLEAKIAMANYHPTLDLVHPIMPSVIPVGGLQITDPKPLPKDFGEIYGRKSKGNVIFSLGTNVKSELLGQGRLNEILGALRELPEYNFFWKIDIGGGLDLEIPKNVFIKKWLPQNDLLADNRTVLFISHAGGLSTQEATWFGMPMLALPVMFDQFPNAEKAVKSGMALKLDIRDIEKSRLKATILELIENKKYSERARIRSSNFRDQPEKPVERALWWIDYVLRNPDITFLRSSRLEGMNYFVKHSMDVIAFLTVVYLIILLVIVKVLCLSIRKWKERSVQKVKRQ